MILACVMRLIIIHKGNNDFRNPHSKIRTRFAKAKAYGMEVPMVGWPITKEEYDSGEALLDKWRTEEGENSLDLHSPNGQEGNDDDSDANSDVEEL